MKNSKIEWTHHTFNPWIGCTRVSPGCVHCYAETMMADRYKKVEWGPQGRRIRTSVDYWQQPHKWNREAQAAGERRRVFCASLADVFEDKPDQAADLNNWRLDLSALIHATPHLDWLILTKRPELVKWDYSEWPHNIWIGTSVENQEYADKRIPELLKIPAAVRFLSVEPMLGPVDLTCVSDGNAIVDPTGFNYLNVLQGFSYDADGEYSGRIPKINWVIVGGESGHGARPMHRDWARSIRDQCLTAGVPFLFKQWGEWRWNYFDRPVERAGWYPERVGKHRAGRLLDGREWNEYPTAA